MFGAYWIETLLGGGGGSERVSEALTGEKAADISHLRGLWTVPSQDGMRLHGVSEAVIMTPAIKR